MSRKIGEQYRAGVRSASSGFFARRSAEFMLSEIRGPNARDFLIPSYIVVLCTGIEAAVNDVYIDHFYHAFGGNYKRYLRPFLFLNYRERLQTLFPLISDYRYQLNESDERVVQLFRMFELRGRLVHVKNYRFPATVVEHEEGSEIIFDDPNPEFYEKAAQIPAAELTRYLKLHRLFSSYLFNINYRIRRKNFNPKGILEPLRDVI